MTNKLDPFQQALEQAKEAEELEARKKEAAKVKKATDRMKIWSLKKSKRKM